MGAFALRHSVKSAKKPLSRRPHVGGLVSSCELQPRQARTFVNHEFAWSTFHMSFSLCHPSTLSRPPPASIPRTPKTPAHPRPTPDAAALEEAFSLPCQPLLFADPPHNLIHATPLFRTRGSFAAGDNACSTMQPLEESFLGVIRGC